MGCDFIFLIFEMDSVANMLTALVNAQRVGKERVAVPHTCFKEQLARLLRKKEMVSRVSVRKGDKQKLVVGLAYDGDRPRIKEVKRISRPGRRVYVRCGSLPYAGRRPGMYVVSTDQGLMDEMEARRKGLGGELVCEIWQG